MQKLLFKNRIIFCAIAFAMALIALLASCESVVSIENTTVAEVDTTETVATVEAQTIPELTKATTEATTEVTTVFETTAETTIPEETTVAVTTAETTDVPEPSTKDISEFATFDASTPEYKLYELLSERVPTVEETVAVTLEDGSETIETLESAGKVSLYYKDLTSGGTLIWNGEEDYSAASMIKAVYCYALLVSADNEELDLEEEIIYDSEMFVEGTGKFKDVESGTAFTVRDLISYTMRYSDNTAYSMLRARFGVTYFAPTLEEKGITPTRYSRWWNGDVCQYGDFFAALAEYLMSDSENGKWLSDEMQASHHIVMLKNALYPDRVAHKYGWDVGSYCDGAVALHREHPYAVVFMSNLDKGHLNQANTDFIYELGDLLREIHYAKYEVAG